MSLINDMLRDLDSDAAVKADEPLPSGLKSFHTKPAMRRGWILPVLAAAAVIYVLVVEMNLLGLMPQSYTSPTEIPQPIALNSKWLTQGPAGNATQPVALEKIVPTPEPVIEEKPVWAERSVTEPVLHAAEIPTEVTTALSELPPETTSANTAQSLPEIPSQPAGPQTVAAVEKLLQAGTSALQENRLTTPAGDNAYQYFKSALLLQPENPQAIAGVAQIQQNYLHWLEQALAANRQEAAQRYWFKARTAGVAPGILAEYQQRLAGANIPAVADATISTAANANATLPAPAATRTTKTAATLPAQKSFSAATPQFSDDASTAARLARDGLVLGEARALRGLEEGFAMEQTAVVLADFYAALEDPSKLSYLHQLLSARGSAATVYAQAHLAAQRQNFSLAAEQLAAVEFIGPAEERRLRTLAGFYQKLKDYGRAMPLYSKLVNMPSSSVNDWLGLAVSADAQQLTSVAQNAYLNLLRLTHPDPRIMGFARQRHQDLSFSSSR